MTFREKFEKFCFLMVILGIPLGLFILAMTRGG